MPNNKHLNKAKNAKNDEFFTQYEDIAKECQYYSEDFKDKYIYLPCDDEKSNFWKYFVDNFHNFKLKHLTATHIDFNTNSYRLDYNGTETIKTALEANGDFRSEECIEFLKECDVVVTNPPFSLFRSFVKTLFDYDKKFLIIGNMNAITYKEIFPYIKNNQLWLGVSMNSTKCSFLVSNEYDKANTFIDYDGKKKAKINNTGWFTNIDNKKRNTPLDLYKKYNEKEFPKYDNYNAIEVSKVCDIPMDYDGVMGVPITFLDKYCPTQFEIIGLDRYVEDNPRYGHRFTINQKETYARILIKHIV